MDWLILILSGLLEAVWATALAASKGFKKLVPSLVFLITMTLSTIGLAIAMKTIPTGTAYAVWTGIGASMTAAWAMFRGTEPRSIAKILLLLLLISSVVGLKVVS